MRTRILLGGLVVIGLLALMAIGTYAIFSDNVASDRQDFAAGTVDIDVNEQDELFETTLDMTNMEPGDCKNMALVVRNKGSLDVNLWNWIYPRGDIFSCDPNPACNMYVQKTLVADPNTIPENLNASGDTETYDLKACLPLCAGNNCQGKTGYFRLFFHAVQESNLDGYECVKLEDKSAATDWMPDPTTPPHGNLCYKAVDTDSNACTDSLHIVVNGYNLAANACFQLDLTGGDMNDPHDGACTAQDAALAGMVPGDLYSSGYWNWGTYLEASCNPTNGGEGVWNYAGVYQASKVCSDATGAISYEGYLNLPAGNYIVKAHVKEITAPWPGTAWTEKLAEMDYLRFSICE